MLALLMMAGVSATAQTRTMQKSGRSHQINRVEKVMAQAPRRLAQDEVVYNDTVSQILVNKYDEIYEQYCLVLYGKYYDYIFWINDNELKLNHEYTIANGGLDSQYCGAADDYTDEDFYCATAASLYVTQDEHGMYTIVAQLVFEGLDGNLTYNVYCEEVYYEDVCTNMHLDNVSFASENVIQVMFEGNNYWFIYALKGLTFDADKEYTAEDINPNYSALYLGGEDFLELSDAYLKKTIVNGKVHVEGWVAVGINYIAFTYDEPTGTAIDQTENAKGVMKTIENGQLIIRREGVRYNAMGVQIR